MIDVEFMYYKMTFSERKLNTLSSGTTISYLSRKEFENFKVLIPNSVIEQQKIANSLSSLDKKITLLNNQIDDSTEFKQGLFQKMFV